MGYASRIKPAELERLQPLIQAVEALPEGEGISYTDHPLAVSRTRTLMYNYFALNDQQGLFRIENPSPGELRITRLRTFTPAVDLVGMLARFTSPASKRRPAVAVQPERAPRVHATGPGMQFVKDNLASLLDVEEPQAVQALSEAGLSEEDQAVGLSEWRRIQGKEVLGNG